MKVKTTVDFEQKNKVGRYIKCELGNLLKRSGSLNEIVFMTVSPIKASLSLI